MSNPTQKHPILTDRPANKDGLDFQPYIDSLAELIINSGAGNTPLTIGVFGRWGSGKTSLMQLIQQQVDDKGYKTVWFNAWKYEREALAMWRVLILRTLDALRPRDDEGRLYTPDELPDPTQKTLLKELDHLEQSVYQTVEWSELGKWTVDWAKALEGTVEGAAELALSLVPGAGPLVGLLRQARNTVKGEEVAPLSEAFQREVREFRREQLRSVEQFITTFEQTISTHLLKRGERLVLFVDDLDRCLPERTVEVLEAIKLFLDVPGCIFVLGVDPAKVQEGIRLRYEGSLSAEEGADYLQKIIQVPFILPDIDPQDMRHFVESLPINFPDRNCVDVFALGIAPNPRQIKRTINIYTLLWTLAGKRHLKSGQPAAADQPERPPLLSEVLTPVRLAKVVVIQHSYPDLYELLKLTPRYLRDLETYFLAQADGREGARPPQMREDIEGTAGAASSDSASSEAGSEHGVSLPGPLEPLAQRAGLRRLFSLFPDNEAACFRRLTPTQLRLYITLAGRAEPEPAPAETRSRVQRGFEPEMVSIPAGAFLMGSPAAEVEQGPAEENETPQHTVNLAAYEIGRYPVTNQEYSAFVEATGHASPKHWESGQFPDDLADHPVIRVTWNDAVAYCRWLSEATGQAYRLPTEGEWERAARGTDGRRYPWGDDFDQERCNTKEAGVGTTTPVGQYSPAGDSPAGCADMAGNVWEWCSTVWQEKAYPFQVQDEWSEKYRNQGSSRVLRGGSFVADKEAARAAFRDGFDRNSRGRRYGFRVVVAPSSHTSEL